MLYNLPNLLLVEQVWNHLHTFGNAPSPKCLSTDLPIPHPSDQLSIRSLHCQEYESK